MSSSFFLFVIISLSAPLHLLSEVRKYDDVLIPYYPSISYSEAAIYGPGGSIDLSDLGFTSNFAKKCFSDPNLPHCSSPPTNSLILTLLLFPEPDSCATRPLGCSWLPLGVGKRGKATDPRVKTANDDVYYYCCTEEAVMEGVCDDTQRWTAIIGDDFTANGGVMMELEVPISDLKAVHLDQKQTLDKTGYYLFALLNCNEQQLTISANGEVEWKSHNGYLPANLRGFLGLFVAVVFCFLSYLFLYLRAMRENRYYLIKLQYCIATVIILGLGEGAFKSIDLSWWNVNGRRSMMLQVVGVIFSVGKRSLCRCLILMVSMGWGIARHALPPNSLMKIGILGIVYAGSSGVYDVMINLSQEKDLGDSQWVDTANWFSFVSTCLDVLFYIWIFDALKQTIDDLGEMGQTIKLSLYKSVRLTLVASALYSATWSILLTTDKWLIHVFNWRFEWVMDGGWLFLYLALLVVVGWMFWPNERSSQFAFHFQVSLGAVEREGASNVEEGQGGGSVEMDVRPPSLATSVSEGTGLDSYLAPPPGGKGSRNTTPVKKRSNSKEQYFNDGRNGQTKL